MITSLLSDSFSENWLARGLGASRYFRASIISMSRFNTPLRSSERPIPFRSALREKYSQTLRSIEAGGNALKSSGKVML